MAAHKKALLLFPAVLVVGGLGWWYTLTHRKPSDDAVRVSGNIEVTEVGVSFKIAGRVERRLVDEGDSVARGQLIAELDVADLKAEVDLGRAELQAAQAVLAEFEAGSRPEEINAARATMEKAAAVLAEYKAGSRPQEIDTAQAELAAALVEKNRLEAEWRPCPPALQREGDRDRAIRPGDGRLSRGGRTVPPDVRALQAGEGGTAAGADRPGPGRLAQAQAQYGLVKQGPRKEQSTRPGRSSSRPKPRWTWPRRS